VKRGNAPLYIFNAPRLKIENEPSTVLVGCGHGRIASLVVLAINALVDRV
jgi:hypothetical protein